MVNELRKNKKWSQANLSKKMGKSQSTIGRIVKPTISMLEQIAAATDTKLEISFAYWIRTDRKHEVEGGTLRLFVLWETKKVYDKKYFPPIFSYL